MRIFPSGISFVIWGEFAHFTSRDKLFQGLYFFITLSRSWSWKQEKQLRVPNVTYWRDPWGYTTSSTTEIFKIFKLFFFILVIKICCYRHLRSCVEPALDLKCFISFYGKERDKKRKFMLVRKALCTRLFCWFVFLIAACVWVMAGLEKQYSSWPCRLALVLFSSLPFVFTLPT